LADSTLDAVVQRIQQKWGAQAIRPAHQLHSAPTSLQTGFVALDHLSGGIARRKISVWSGVPTCGMTTLACHLMAQAQQRGENVVYIDQSCALDGASAAACGVQVEELLLVEVREQQVALAVLREVVASGVVGLVVVNLLGSRSRTVDLSPLLIDLHQHACAVLLLLPPDLHSLQATLRVHFQRVHWLRQKRAVVGCLSRVTIQRRPDGRTGEQTTLLIPLLVEGWP
jgi:hypothetical protein